MAYDALGRLRESVGAGVTTRFLYDGADMIGEYNASNALLRRHVFGPGSDEPLVWYEGAGTGDRRWLIADQLGSVVAVSNASGAALAVNAYDEYGTPGPANAGRFGYTGQAWLPEAQLYHYKARAYSPNLGRFLQTDPIGLAGGIKFRARGKTAPPIPDLGRNTARASSVSQSLLNSKTKSKRHQRVLKATSKDNQRPIEASRCCPPASHHFGASCLITSA